MSKEGGSNRNSIIPMPLENGKPVHVSPFINKVGTIIVTDLVKQIFPAREEQTELLAQDLNQALNTVRFRLPHLYRARDLVLSQVKDNGARRAMDMYNYFYAETARKTDLSAFTSFAIAKFLQTLLPREEFDFRVAVVIPPRLIMDFQTKPVHFVTAVCFNRVNKVGGMSVVENPKKMLFLDASSPHEVFSDKLQVDSFANMQNYGFRPYDPKKENHRQNIFARRAFDGIYRWMGRDLDNYSQFLYEALVSPEKISEFQYNPDLFGNALVDSLNRGNQISAEVKERLAAVFPPGFFIKGLEHHIRQKGKSAKDIRIKVAAMIDELTRIREEQDALEAAQKALEAEQKAAEAAANAGKDEGAAEVPSGAAKSEDATGAPANAATEEV